MMNYPKLNCFEKTEVRWEKYFKIMVKLAQNSIRSTKLSIAYSPCYMQFWAFALLRLCLISGVGKGKMRGIVRKIAYNGYVYGVVADYERLTFKLTIMIERETDLQIGTNPPCTIHDVVCSTDFGNGIILYNDDCLQALRKINDKQFNLAITDPPYNVGRLYNEHDDEMPLLEYENWCKEWFNELLRVSETVVMTIGYKNLKFWMNLDPKHMIIWHKPNQNSPSPLGGFNAYEPVLFWGKLQKRIGHDIFKTNIAMQEEAKWHNCPKHLPSWTKLIDMIIDKPAKVLDPFTGSGTTAIACHDLKLEFTGYELDAMYYKKACKRIKGYTSQMALW